MLIDLSSSPAKREKKGPALQARGDEGEARSTFPACFPSPSHRTAVGPVPAAARRSQMLALSRLAGEEMMR